MTIKTTLTSLIAAAVMIAAAQAQAESDFDTLAGIEADPMNAQEMDKVQGKYLTAYEAGYAGIYFEDWSYDTWYRYYGGDSSYTYQRHLERLAWANYWDQYYNGYAY